MSITFLPLCSSPNVQGTICLGSADLPGPCLKGGVWIEEKIDERVKIESGGHSSEYRICLMFISHSFYIPKSREEGKASGFFTQIQRTN